MAAYIDLNPVRTGMVDDPEEYPRISQNEAEMLDAKDNGTVLPDLGNAADNSPLESEGSAGGDLIRR